MILNVYLLRNLQHLFFQRTFYLKVLQVQAISLAKESFDSLYNNCLCTYHVKDRNLLPLHSFLHLTYNSMDLCTYSLDIICIYVAIYLFMFIVFKVVTTFIVVCMGKIKRIIEMLNSSKCTVFGHSRAGAQRFVVVRPLTYTKIEIQV